MHILLFGASGHVGTGVAERLAPNHDITGIVRRPPDTNTPYTPMVIPDWVDEPRKVAEALAEAVGPSAGTKGSPNEDGAPPVEAVIAAIGGWYVDAPVLERGLAKFDSDYDSYLRGHFSACEVSRMLAEGGAGLCHLALNGVASVEALAGSGAISVFGAAQNMLIRVADEETDTVAFRELRIMAPIGGDDRNDLTGGVQTISLAEVAEQVQSIIGSPDRFDVSTEIAPER
jgi:NAD(P)-dependent dehydrogenase (short-subunit alcohol dehydrogenase family)